MGTVGLQSKLDINNHFNDFPTSYYRHDDNFVFKFISDSREKYYNVDIAAHLLMYIFVNGLLIYISRLMAIRMFR